MEVCQQREARNLNHAAKVFSKQHQPTFFLRILPIVFSFMLLLPTRMYAQAVDQTQLATWNRSLKLYEEKDSDFFVADTTISDLMNISISSYIENRREAAKRGWVEDRFLHEINLIRDNMPEGYELADSLKEKYNAQFIRPEKLIVSRERTLWALQLVKVTGKDDSVSLCFAEVALYKNKKRGKDKKKSLIPSYGIFYIFHFKNENGRWVLFRKEGKTSWAAGGTLVFFP